MYTDPTPRCRFQQGYKHPYLRQVIFELVILDNCSCVILITHIHVGIAENSLKLPRPDHAPYLRPVGNEKDGCL